MPLVRLATSKILHNVRNGTWRSRFLTALELSASLIALMIGGAVVDDDDDAEEEEEEEENEEDARSPDDDWC